MFKAEPKVSPVFEAVERATTNDMYLDVGQVMSFTTVHELRCRFQNREPEFADRLETHVAIDELVLSGKVSIVEMFGSMCVKRLT